MRRSLLDDVDLAALRPLCAGGGVESLAAMLVDGGVVAMAADDPLWPDRDRIVTGGEQARTAVVARLRAAELDARHDPETRRRGGAAVAVAMGLAGTSARQGGVWRALCVLDVAAAADGEVWEAARTAVASGAGASLKVAVAAGDTAPMWAAWGWAVSTAPADDPARLLAAFDHALAEPARPAAVVAT